MGRLSARLSNFDPLRFMNDSFPNTHAMRLVGRFFGVILLGVFLPHQSFAEISGVEISQIGGALVGERPRVLVSTDIGGTDPDDFQSMVHLLVYSDLMDIEGLVSSPYGGGRVEDILDVIDCYEKDYPNLRTYSDNYPDPQELRAVTKQGEIARAPYSGVRASTEGSEWIVSCARREDSRPLHVLIWGGIEDLAQALSDAPDILPQLRVYYIGGPNKKWGPDAYQYLVDHHPLLWIIESNATYRGWFTGGEQEGGWENKRFVQRYVRGRGALGDFFVQKKDDIKMGDTPSVGWLLNGVAEDPSQPGWGGRYVHAWERPYLRLDRMPTSEDQIEIFGVLELVLDVRKHSAPKREALLVVENQRLPGFWSSDGTVRFRFSPKAARGFRFRIEAKGPELNGKSGAISVTLPEASRTDQAALGTPHWWTDDPSPQYSEQGHHGAKTVNRWRKEFLADFAARLERCREPQRGETADD